MKHTAVMLAVLFAFAAVPSDAQADRPITYVAALTALGPNICLTRKPGPLWDCQADCVELASGGADKRVVPVTATDQATVAACFVALQAACAAIP